MNQEENRVLRIRGLPSPPDRGRIIVVNFELGGGKIGDEMCKPKRPCVVVQNSKLHRGRLVTVVPISTTEPQPIKPWHHQLDHRSFRDWPIGWDGQGTPRWALCDYLTTVSLERCTDPYRVIPYQARRYIKVRIAKMDLDAIEVKILWALGIQPPAEAPEQEDG